MKKMMMIGVYGLVILGVSAGGTWYLRMQDMKAQAEAETEPEKLIKSVTDVPPPVDVTQPTPPARDRTLPVAVRPEKMEISEIVRYGLALKEREQAIREQEDALRKTEKRHDLILGDIENEKAEMMGLVAEAREHSTAGSQLLAEAQKKYAESEKLLKELDDRQRKMEIDKERAKSQPNAGASGNMEIDREANIKAMVSRVAGMSAERAAGVVTRFANTGKMDMAVEILAKLEERNAAKILDALPEEQLVSEILAKFAELERPVKR